LGRPPESVEAAAAVHTLLRPPTPSKIENSKSKILIEDCLVGEETSILVVVSGRDYVILPTSQDHKRIGDGDTGPNTGGMGTYSPAEVVTPDLLKRIEDEIVRPSVNAIADEGIDYCGTLFIGIMLTPAGPSVIEYNARFGDPETQVVLPRLTSSLVDLLHASAVGSSARGDGVASTPVAFSTDAAVTVVLASGGYPGEHRTGVPITGAEDAAAREGVHVFHAGTARDPAGRLVTAGGRVLSVTALAADLVSARARAYDAVAMVGFEGMQWRRDIGTPTSSEA
jgi:phosphoribosylamine--glycine ligase